MQHDGRSLAYLLAKKKKGRRDVPYYSSKRSELPPQNKMDTLKITTDPVQGNSNGVLPPPLALYAPLLALMQEGEGGANQSEINLHALSQTDYTRVIRIARELAHGFAELALLPPSVVVWGSSKKDARDPAYKAAYETARLLAQAGFAVITGGGPGIMEAANKGAREQRGISIGFPLESLTNEAPNAFLDLSLVFRYFITRKTMFVKYAQAMVIFPGGYGTLDELFEALCLIQTQRIHAFPIILFGSAFWGGLIAWMRETLDETEHTIKAEDLDLVRIVDDPQEIVRIVSGAYREVSSAPRKPLLYL